MPARRAAALTLRAVLACTLAAATAGAQDVRPAARAVVVDTAADATADTTPAPPAVRIDLPLADLPYGTRFGGRAPSMQQSLGVTAGVYDAAHLGIQRAWGRHTWLAKATIAVTDYVVTGAPFADAWLHEEWHRAVLGNRGIGSRNDVYRLNLFSETISVSHARDEDLARLKREHPAEFVRLKAAGIEAEYALVTRLQRDQFYRGGRAWHTALYWLTTINSVLYLADTTDTDAYTDDANRDEPTVAVRDISGHDFTAWVRDLHRPGEPFEARGVHPSGVGVNRYVKTTDLAPEERRYLHRQGRLALLNFLDPNLLGIHGFTVRRSAGGPPLRANLTVRHALTSFGHTVDANVFLKQGPTNLFVVLHAYANGARTFPGLDVELVDQVRTVGGRRVELSPRLALWAQPEGQAFRTQDARVGGLAALRVRVPIARRLGALAEVEAKTAGWVAGVVQLDRAVNLRLGVSTTLW
ncbi:MAG TPA: hypothetical protein VEZ47_10545 [Gemmatirosa sp.]|nr:hypothetical protein [Gemmatirosa sp.]